MMEIMVQNTLRLMCFTVLAIAFRRWWIVFFALLFWLIKD